MHNSIAYKFCIFKSCDKRKYSFLLTKFKVCLKAHKVIQTSLCVLCTKLNDNGVAKLQELGMSVYEPTEEELADWHDAMRDPCVEYGKSQLGDEIVDELLNAIDAVRG